MPLPLRTSPQAPVPAVLENSIVSGGSGSRVVVVVVVGAAVVDVVAPVVDVVWGAMRGGGRRARAAELAQPDRAAEARRAGTGQRRRAVDQDVARVGDAEGRREADGWTTSSTTGPGRHAGLREAAARRAAEAALVAPERLAGTEEPRRITVARGAGDERRQVDGDRTRSELPSAPPGTQSAERPPVFVVMQVSPARAPRSHVPVAGAAGEPTAWQRGHGWVPLPVT